MARRPRDDAPGRWHHVTNRGLSNRTMFEGEPDFRMFLALVAKEVRAGRLEVHTFCLMLDHHHLLVRSPTGQLAEAMANIQREYSRWFNRTRKRDGPLVKGRYKSKAVRDLVYRCNVVTYIHDNPVHAKEVDNPADFEASSAWYWAHRHERKMPRWLATDWIQGELDNRGVENLEDVFPRSLSEYCSCRHAVPPRHGQAPPSQDRERRDRSHAQDRTRRGALNTPPTTAVHPDISHATRP